MESKYIDLLMVKKTDERLALVISEAHLANEGSIVAFNGGKLGQVVMKAWGGERDGEIQRLVSALVPTYEADEVYYQSWKKDGFQDAEIPGNS